jgi:hypothetical protein
MLIIVPEKGRSSITVFGPTLGANEIASELSINSGKKLHKNNKVQLKTHICDELKKFVDCWTSHFKKMVDYFGK